MFAKRTPPPPPRRQRAFACGACGAYGLTLLVFGVAATWYIGTVSMLGSCSDDAGLVLGPGPPPPGVLLHPRRGEGTAGDGAADAAAIAAAAERADEDAAAMAAAAAAAEDAAAAALAAANALGAATAAGKTERGSGRGGGRGGGGGGAGPRAVPRVKLPAHVVADARVRRAATALLAALERGRAADGGADADRFDFAAAQLADAVLAAGAAPLAEDDAPATAPPEYTQMTCYLQSDESEVCVFDGVLCFDGKSPVVVVEDPVRDPERILDYTHSCQDFRYYEPSALGVSGCAYAYSFDRPYNASLPVAPGTDFPLPLERRRWGPQNRNGLLFFKEVTPEEVWGPRVPAAAPGAAAERAATRIAPRPVPPERDSREGEHLPPERDSREGEHLPPLTSFDGSPGVDGDTRPPFFASPSGGYAAHLERDGAPAFEHEGLPGLRLVRRTTVGNRTIDWVDGALWLAGIDGQFWQNPYHWWTKVGALYDARRANASDGWGAHPRDGSLVSSTDLGDDAVAAAAAAAAAPGGGPPPPPGAATLLPPGAPGGTRNRAAFRVGRQWRLPPMDVVAFAGDGANVLKGRSVLNPWFKRTLELATQPGTATYFNDLLSSLGDWRYLCATRGAIPGAKNKMFTGRSDAWMWRQYAYEAAGLAARGVTPHPRYPPRKVTVLARKGLNGRGIFNIDGALAALNASGLPYELVPNMAALSFDDQVALMAGTGILIAPHGAHLANTMFLPAHAVVVELFPYLMKKNTYRHLATMMDVHYMPIYSWELLPLNYTQFYGVQLMGEKYYYDKCVRINISSYEALTEHACNAMSKNYPILLNMDQFAQVLRDGIDAIGAFSMLNPEWAALVARGEGVPPPPRPQSLTEAHVHAASQPPWDGALVDVPPPADLGEAPR